MRTSWSKSDRIQRAIGLVQIVLGTSVLITADGPGYVMAGLFLLMLGFDGLMRPALFRAAYNRGWMDGRIAMIASLSEAQQRRMHPMEWLIAEAERDGFTVTVHTEPND